jgi:hypothetical protein
MSDLEVSMMKRVGELNKEVANLKAEIKVLQGQPDPLTVYLYAAELAKDVIKKLKAENELLKGQVNYWKIEAECDHGRWLRCLEDLEKLRASSFVTAVPVEQYERVIKAGDELHAFLINYIVEGRISSAYLNKLDDGWNAAKEGKQP